MNNVAQRLLAMVRDMANTDFAQLPAHTFMGALRRALIAQGFPGADAELIISRMKVDVAPGKFTDEELAEMAGHYATILGKIRDSLHSQGFEQPMHALQEMAREMSLTCN
jgi:hypothetical protein